MDFLVDVGLVVFNDILWASGSPKYDVYIHHTCKYIYIYIYTYIYIHIYVCICMFIYMYVLFEHAGRTMTDPSRCLQTDCRNPFGIRFEPLKNTIVSGGLAGGEGCHRQVLYMCINNKYIYIYIYIYYIYVYIYVYTYTYHVDR